MATYLRRNVEGMFGAVECRGRPQTQPDPSRGLGQRPVETSQSPVLFFPWPLLLSIPSLLSFLLGLVRRGINHCAHSREKAETEKNTGLDSLPSPPHNERYVFGVEKCSCYPSQDK